jgi:hypothetical protein
LPGTDEKFERPVLLARGETDTDWRFRLDASRTSSVRFFNVFALTAAPGFGWAELNPADVPEADGRTNARHSPLMTCHFLQGSPVAWSNEKEEEAGLSMEDAGCAGC